MIYKLTSENDQQMVFSTKPPAHPFIGFAVSIGFICSGFVIHFFYPGMGDMPWAIIKIIFWALGTFIFTGSVFTPHGVLYMLPTTILDNSVGAIVVAQRDAQACIPYHQIQDFNIYDKVSGKDRDSHYFYVYAACKDGSKWYLTETLHQKVADEMLLKIKTHCNLSLPFTGTDVMPAKSAIEQSSQRDKFLVAWSNKIKGRPIRLAVATLALIGFIAIFAVGAFFTPDPEQAQIGFVGSFFALAISTIPGYFLFKAIARLIRDITTRYALVATEARLEYLEFNKKSGHQKNEQLFQWTDIEAIRYDFTADIHYDNHIKISLRQGNQLEFHLDQASPVERLQVANALRRFQALSGITT